MTRRLQIIVQEINDSGIDHGGVSVQGIWTWPADASSDVFLTELRLMDEDLRAAIIKQVEQRQKRCACGAVITYGDRCTACAAKLLLATQVPA